MLKTQDCEDTSQGGSPLGRIYLSFSTVSLTIHFVVSGLQTLKLMLTFCVTTGPRQQPAEI